MLLPFAIVPVRRRPIPNRSSGPPEQRRLFVERLDERNTPTLTPFPIGDDILVQNASPNQKNSSIGIDGDGDFVVVWTGPEGTSYGNYYRLFDATGTPATPEFSANEFSMTTEQSKPSVAMYADGEFVVAWEATSNGGIDARALLGFCVTLMSYYILAVPSTSPRGSRRRIHKVTKPVRSSRRDIMLVATLIGETDCVFELPGSFHPVGRARACILHVHLHP